MLTVLQLHQDTYNILIKPLMGDRDYPDSPKSCKSFEKRGQRRESVPSNLFALLCLRTERWARAGLSPCATRHPGLFPTAQRHGLLLRTEVDTEKPWFRGWMSGAAEFNMVSWRQRRKRKTHTHKSMSAADVKFYLQFYSVSCFWCVWCVHPRGVKKPAFRFWGSTSIGSMESMPCRWRSTTNWVVSPSSSGAGLTWWKMSRVQMRPGRLKRRKHSNGFASSSRYMASTKVNEKGLDENSTRYQD